MEEEEKEEEEDGEGAYLSLGPRIFSIHAQEQIERKRLRYRVSQKKKLTSIVKINTQVAKLGIRHVNYKDGFSTRLRGRKKNPDFHTRNLDLSKVSSLLPSSPPPLLYY